MQFFPYGIYNINRIVYAEPDPQGNNRNSVDVHTDILVRHKTECKCVCYDNRHHEKHPRNKGSKRYYT